MEMARKQTRRSQHVGAVMGLPWESGRMVARRSICLACALVTCTLSAGIFSACHPQTAVFCEPQMNFRGKA